MNDQYDNPDMVERTYNDMSSPDVNSDSFTNKVPVDTDLIHDTPMGETDIHETLKDEMIVEEMPIGETIIPRRPLPQLECWIISFPT